MIRRQGGRKFPSKNQRKRQGRNKEYLPENRQILSAILRTGRQQLFLISSLELNRILFFYHLLSSLAKVVSLSKNK